MAWADGGAAQVTGWLEKLLPDMSRTGVWARVAAAFGFRLRSLYELFLNVMLVQVP